MKKIPINCLIVLVDVPTGTKNDLFPEKIISFQSVLESLVSGQKRPDLRTIVNEEIIRTIGLRLSFGQRVILDSNGLNRDVRINIVDTFVKCGYTVFYVVDNVSTKRELLKNDHASEIFDTATNINIINPLPDNNMFAALKERGYMGVTVVGDVHGMMNQLRNAVSWARTRNHFLMFLGDLVDYGIDTLEVSDEVYNLVNRGEAESLYGNHERKIFRYISQRESKTQYPIKLSGGNLVTVDRLNQLSEFDYTRWKTRFIALTHMMRSHRVCDKFIFAHGAVSPAMWDITDNRLSGRMEELTLFGEVNNKVKRPDGYPNRIYNWTTHLTYGQIAIVGHDIRSTGSPLIVKNAHGGTAIFLDTGCGKDGHLSTLDIRFTDTGSIFENINLH